jgi:short subunit dehydrogenase-like uncharacterized protein
MGGKRDLDVVVFGATGFTGARVAEEVLAKAQAASLKVGLAGRDEAKLRALAQRLPGGDRAAILAGVDMTEPESLQRMASATRLLLNCVGPYRCAPRRCWLLGLASRHGLPLRRSPTANHPSTPPHPDPSFYGAPVFAAAAAAGTDYLDLCGCVDRQPPLVSAR